MNNYLWKLQQKNSFTFGTLSCSHVWHVDCVTIEKVRNGVGKHEVLLCTQGLCKTRQVMSDWYFWTGGELRDNNGSEMHRFAFGPFYRKYNWEWMKAGWFLDKNNPSLIWHWPIFWEKWAVKIERMQFSLSRMPYKNCHFFPHIINEATGEGRRNIRQGVTD